MLRHNERSNDVGKEKLNVEFKSELNRNLYA